jgi:hypothetical protein
LRPRLYKIAHSAQFSARQATRRFKARGAGIPSSRRRARALQSRTARIIDRCHRPNGRILGRARKGLAYATHARAVRRDDSGCTFNSGKARRVCARRVEKSLCLREPRRQCNGVHLHHWRGDHTSLQNRFFAGTAKRGTATRHLWCVRWYKSQTDYKHRGNDGGGKRKCPLSGTLEYAIYDHQRCTEPLETNPGFQARADIKRGSPAAG